MRPGRRTRRAPGLDRRRVLAGYALALVLPALLALVLVPLRGRVNLISDMLLFLLAAVVVALIGGIGPALVSAVIGTVTLNYWFTPPLHTLSIADPTNVIALVVFVLVALAVSSGVDLAARRTTEAAYAAAERESLAAVDRTRTALLAAVSHDLRTPLAAARASVASLRSADVSLDDDDRAELIATADESLVQLTGLLEDLLDVTRLQVGAVAVTRRPIGLDEVAARALDGLGPDGRRVEVALPADLPSVLADPGLLERVLVNLLANAVRFSPTGRPPRLTAGPDDDGVAVLVVDHGPGIPAADHDRVFLPFHRLGDTDNHTGVGLGLALARGLAEAMGGTLSPEETPGGGLTMRLLLTLAGVADDAVPGLREQTGEPTGEQAGEQTGEQTGGRR